MGPMKGLVRGVSGALCIAGLALWFLASGTSSLSAENLLIIATPEVMPPPVSNFSLLEEPVALYWLDGAKGLSSQFSILGPDYTGCGGVYDVPFSNAAYEREVVALVNAARADYGLPPLKRVNSLDAAARYHSTDMGQDNYFAHDSYDQGLVDPVCGWAARVRSYYTGGYLAENIAAGQGTPASVMDAWMNSAGHRANILHPSFWEIGVGYYEGSGAYYRYWTQDFGRRSDIYPLVINSEAFTTAQQDIMLYVYGSGTWDEMRLRNNTEAWDTWRPFTSEISWTLPLIAGEHTVWVELRRGDQTVQSKDEIILQLPPSALNDVPSQVAFTYRASQDQLYPASRVITLVNMTSELPIAWDLVLTGTWFTVAPTAGTTPGAFAITPTTFVTTHPGTYIGAVTVTAGALQEVQNVPQRMDLTLNVDYPKLGLLPSVISFTYSTKDHRLYPDHYVLTPENVGGEDPLVWSLTSNVHWITPSPPFTSITPQAVRIIPVGFNTSMVAMYDGVITITVLSPVAALGSPHPIDVILKVTDTSLASTDAFLPLISRNYTPPIKERTPDDPGYAFQWALETIDAPSAWGVSLGDDVLVAVLDTGAHFAHEDLVGKLRGDIDWDYINNDSTAQDDHGHGTHVTGIIAATPNNGLGGAGLGWNTEVVPFKILDHEGSGTLSMAVPAIYAATDQGVKVINMSLGSNPKDALRCGDFPELVAALEYAYTHGVLVVVAAGNQGQDASDVVPANCPYVLTVAATDISDLPADFTYAVASNYGQAVDVAAPGKFIYATWLESRPPYTPYAYLEGTSMATPFVGALAALVWAKYPLTMRDAVTPDQVAAVILDTSLDLGASGWDQDYGCGRIRAAEAVITGTLGSQPVCRPDALAGLDALGGRGASRWERLLKRQRWSSDAGALGIPGDYVPGRLVIGFKDINDLPQDLKAEVLRLEWLNLLHNLGVYVERQLPNGVVIARVTEGQEWAVAQQLFHNPLVAYVHPDYWISAR